MGMSKKVFFRLTLVLGIMCAATMLFVPPGTPEFTVLIISAAINFFCAGLGIALTIAERRRKK